MYECKKQPFGKFTKWVISNNQGNQLVILPEFGACLLEAQLNGTHILDGYDEPLQVDINKWYKNVLLYPFPNRLKNGQYTWRGKVYQFPINDPENEAAIHGFGVNKPMEVEKLDCREDSAQIICRYQYAGDHPAFPFPFHFRASFEINNDQQLLITLSATNTGTESMPFGFGWHPYFSISEKIADTQMQLPTCEMVGVDGQMIPTGKRYAFDDFEQLTPIGSTVLDNGFALSSTGNQARFLLSSSRGTLTGRLQTGPGKFNFLQVFTPPYRGAIALEPMTCNIDAFNNGDGLLEVLPGAIVQARFDLAFSQ